MDTTKCIFVSKLIRNFVVVTVVAYDSYFWYVLFGEHQLVLNIDVVLLSK